MEAGSPARWTIEVEEGSAEEQRILAAHQLLYGQSYHTRGDWLFRTIAVCAEDPRPSVCEKCLFSDNCKFRKMDEIPPRPAVNQRKVLESKVNC